MYPRSVLALIAGVICLFLFFVELNPIKEKDRAKRIFSFFLLSLSGWSIALFILINVPHDQPGLAESIGTLQMQFVALSALFMLVFSLSLLVENLKPLVLALLAPSLIIMALVLQHGADVAYINGSGWHLPLESDHLVIRLGSIYAFGYVLSSLVILSVVIWKLNGGPARKKMMMIYFGMVLMSFLGTVAYIIQRAYPSFPPMGAFSLFLGTILIYFGLTKEFK